ncbi:MAG: hypothetical protein IPK20_13515 [Betaproteobacteria bacterium]|nr:hypothetical protein [Betaproteobacteria bacterium]
MKEYMYDVDGVFIAALLLLSMVIAVDGGARLGRRRAVQASEAFKSHVNGIAASLVGVLALLLGFSFSLALQRYDSRSIAVVEEANALGTAYLRSRLLPPSVREDVRRTMREYIDLRVRSSGISLDHHETRRTALAEAGKLQNRLWDLAVAAADEAPNPVTTGLFIQSLNNAIDEFGRRDASLDRHVPEFVLLLLFVTFLMASAIVGYSAGLSSHRASFVTYVLVALITVLVFVILDLDRPRRGFIRISQHSLLELQAAVHQNEPPASGAVSPGR